MKRVYEGKRNQRSIYFDTRTGLLGAASSMPSKPWHRPYRYIFIGYFFGTPPIYNKRVAAVLKAHGVRPKREKKWLF